MPRPRPVRDLALATSSAHAIEYTRVQADKSQIAFGFQQMGVAMEGAFRKFSSQLRFDPAAPQAATAAIEVDLASVDTGSAEGDEEVARKTWFNTKGFPGPLRIHRASRRSAATSTRSPAS